MKKVLFLLCAPVLLFAQSKDSSRTNVIDNVVCTGQFFPTDARRAVNQVRLIDEQTILRRAANNLEELLSSEANLRFSSDLILGSKIQINGIDGENIKVMIDGVPIVGRLNGNVDLSQIPLHNVLRVEIVQGSLSAIYGSNASGGVINIITKKTQAKPLVLGLQSQVESVGIKTAALNIGGQKGKFLVQANANLYDFGGYPVDTLRTSLWNPKNQKAGQAVVKYYLKENQQLTYTYDRMDELISDLGEVKRPKFRPYAFDEYYKTLRSNHALHYEANSEKSNIQSTLAYNRFFRKVNKYRFDFDRDTQAIVDGEQDTSRINALLWRTIFSKKINQKFSLLTGTELNYENAFSKKIEDNNENRKHFAQILDVSAFVGSKISLLEKQLTLEPILRYAYNSKFNAPLTPAINVLYQANSFWKIRASYARGFRSPSLKELYFNFKDNNHFIVGSTDILAERSHNLSLSPSYSAIYGKMNVIVEANLFYNHIQNRIILAQFGQLPNGQLQYRYANIAEFKTKGAGLSMTINHNERIVLKTSAVYTGYYNTARDENPSLPVYLYSPDLSADFTYTFTGIHLIFNVLYRHIGSTPMYNFGKSGTIEEGKLEGWNLLNTSLTKHFFKNKLTFSLGGKNLLDVRNISSQGAIGVGHSVTAGSQPVSFGRSIFLKAVIRL
jgi:outer membrane receptor for ferrienterochelin and colicins